MARAKGFSLWLMPSGDLCEALAHTILRLSRIYQTPAFEPHVTLLGELTEPEAEVLSKTQHLASLIRPCEIRLSRADYLSDYFRCLFLRVEETKPVMEANLKARKVFNRYRDPKYMPHLSLMYGSLGPGVKETIVPRVGDYFEKRFEVRSIVFISLQNLNTQRPAIVVTSNSLRLIYSIHSIAERNSCSTL